MFRLLTRRDRGPAFLGALVCALALSACSDTDIDPQSACEVDPDSVGSQADGACCEVNRNCAVGSICNRPSDPFFVSTEKENICIRVACETTADCDSPKICTLEKICAAPICQADKDCTGGDVCIGGQCGVGPSLSAVASCKVITPGGILKSGTTKKLSAIARDASGRPLPAITFTWSSSNDAAIKITDGAAEGGSAAGSAEITAAAGEKACEGAATFANYEAAASGSARIIAIRATNGMPIQGAAVFIDTADQRYNGTTDADGVYTVESITGAIEAATAFKDGMTAVTALAPGSSDLVIAMPERAKQTASGGFRGTLDISETAKGDIRLGLVSPAFPSNFLDIELNAILGDFVPTKIEAPELSLDTETDLPGGLMLGLGARTFTDDSADADGIRCQGEKPQTGQLGCFVARANPGPTAPWSFGGQVRLSQVSDLIGLVTGALDGGIEDLPIGELMVKILPLLRELRHGADAGISITESAKIAYNDSGADCSDPTLGTDATPEEYDAACRSDYAKYTKMDLPTAAKMDVLSRVQVPKLPASGDGYTAAAVAIAGALVPDRGFVPLGLSAGLDAIEAGDPADGIVTGVDAPFGAQSGKLDDGYIPMAFAAPHSGLEGAELGIVMFALDPASIAGSGTIQISGLVNIPGTIPSEAKNAAKFMPYPTGTMDTATFAFTPTGATEGAKYSRLDMNNGSNSWLLWAPHGANSITLPDHGALRATLVAEGFDVDFQVIAGAGSYSDLFEFGSGGNARDLGPKVSAFAVQQCTTAEDATCKIQ